MTDTNPREQHAAGAPTPFGVVTMATNADAVVRACALAASVRVHEPGVPIALLTTLQHDAVPPGWFDAVLHITPPEPYAGELRYLNKLVHPLALSPFEHTLFLDDDTLVLRPFVATIEQHFAGRQIAINCLPCAATDERPGTNHLDPSIVCSATGHDICWNTYGGGHMYFERGPQPLVADALAVVTTERALYEEWSRQRIVSDEVALLIAANRGNVGMPSLADFVDAPKLRQTRQITVRVADSRYRWPQRPWGEDIDAVAILHFASSAKRSAGYAREIRRLTGLQQSTDRGARGLLRRLRHDLLRLLRR